MLKQEYFRRFPEDCVIEGCVEVEGGKDGRKGRRKQGEEVDWYRCVRPVRSCSTPTIPVLANSLMWFAGAATSTSPSSASSRLGREDRLIRRAGLR